MLVLDTNVISEALREKPDPAILAWLEAQPPASLFATTITLAEINYGIAIMPPRKSLRDSAPYRRRAFVRPRLVWRKSSMASRSCPPENANQRCYVQRL